MIEVTSLTKHYGPRMAIQDLSFEVPKGSVFGFLGPNGAGKTTTMKILTGFMPATSGNAKIAGFDVFENPMEVKKRVGFLPENLPLYLEMKVKDYLAFAARLHQIPNNSIKTSIDSVLEKTGLTSVKERLINNLSKGFRQRVGLAQALIHNPEILILDEPTVGLDPRQIIEIRELIKNLAGDHTVILSSHILPEVTATCSQIIVINKGKIVANDSLDHLTVRLKQGQVYDLFVKDPKPGGISAIKDIQGIQTVSVKGNHLIMEMNPEAGELRDKVIALAVKNDMGVLEFTPEKLSLEDIFLQLTTEETHLAGEIQ